MMNITFSRAIGYVSFLYQIITTLLLYFHLCTRIHNVLRKIDVSEHRAPFSCFILQELLKCEPAFCSAFFFLLLEKKFGCARRIWITAGSSPSNKTLLYIKSSYWIRQRQVGLEIIP